MIRGRPPPVPCKFRGREATEGTQPVKLNHRLGAALSGAAVLLALSSLSACSSDDTGKKLDAWAKGVCDQAAAQTKKINDANTALTKVDSAGSRRTSRPPTPPLSSRSPTPTRRWPALQPGGAPRRGDKGDEIQKDAVTSLPACPPSTAV